MNSIFVEITLVLVLAGAVSFLVSLLKQPSIVGYILTGLVIGSFGVVKLHDGATLSGLAQIGITLLLFMVGLELDISQLKKIGRNVLFAGVGQVIFTSLIGFFILRALHINLTAALFIAPALTFSSTIIVVKLLSEKRDLQSLYGKLVIGIFLTQDVVSVFILIGLSSFSHGGVYSGFPIWQNVLMVFVRFLLLVLITMWLSSKVFPKILRYIGGNDELLLIFALAWALGLAAFVSLPFMGFSLEIGGFLAGLSLAQSGVHYEISSRIKSIRDFFIIIFFVVLGSGLVITHASALIWPAIILSLFILIGNPLIIFVLLGIMGYKPRTYFFAGVTVAQISEFSLILVALGYEMGFLQSSDVGLVTLIGIITIALSSYMIKYAAWIYERMKWFLVLFDFRKGAAEKNLSTGKALKNHVVLVGAHRLGHHLISALAKQSRPFIIIDFNPEVVENCLEQGMLAICGDITDPYIQEEARIADAKLIVSTIPDFNSNLALVEAVQRFSRFSKSKPKLIFIAQDEAEIKALYDRNIDYVISPHFMGGLHLAKILEDKSGFKNLKKLREHHLQIINGK